MSRNKYKTKIPKIEYKFVESPEAKERLKKAYSILFTAVMKSQDWSNDKDNAIKTGTDK